MKFRMGLLSAAIVLALSWQSAFGACANCTGTEVSGPIIADTTWTKTKSPYCITGNIILFENKTLVIEPGVEVKFCQPEDSTPKYSMVINGQLIARGTADNRIIFTSAASTPAPGDWAYIEMTDKSIAGTYNPDGSYKEGSILEYVTVEYGGGGENHTFKAAKSPYVSHVLFQNNAKGGLELGTSTVIGQSEFKK